MENPLALTEYEKLEENSHPKALRDQLKLLLAPEMRPQYENYISQQAVQKGYTAMNPYHLKNASNATIANLYWYFQDF